MRKSLLLYCCLILSLTAFSKEPPAVGFGFEIGIEKELPKGFDVGLFAELHTCHTFDALEHYCIIAHAGYHFLPWLHTELGYQFLDINNAEDRTDFQLGWNKMHRAFIGLDGGYGIAGFSFNIRERYDFTSPHFSHIWRSQLKLEYEFAKAPIAIIASAELMNNLEQKFRIEQLFTRIGLEWHITKQHTLELCGGFNSFDFQEEERGHLIELGYEFAF